MLKLAFMYKNELNKRFQEIIFDEKYKYLRLTNYTNYELEIENNSWNNIDLISIDQNNNIIGFFSASISRTSDKISSLQIINFKSINYVFSKDLYKFLTDLFKKYNFRKIEFSVVCGNPIEKMYDKYIKKYNGRVVGIRKEHTKLTDNNYYDVKIYEIFRKDYLDVKSNETNEILSLKKEFESWPEWKKEFYRENFALKRSALL